MQQIESKTGHPAAEIDEALELVLQEIGSVLADGESISLGGYGIFVPQVLKKQREGAKRFYKLVERRHRSYNCAL